MNSKIKKAAQEYFKSSAKNELLYTEDGNIFDPDNKSLAVDHARKTGQEVQTLTREEAEGSKRKSESKGVESKESGQKSQDGNGKDDDGQDENGESGNGNEEMPKDEEGNGPEGYDQEQMMKLLDKAVEAGKVVNKGNHFFFGETKLGQGKKNAANSLVQDQKLAGEVQESLNENAKSE